MPVNLSNVLVDVSFLAPVNTGTSLDFLTKPLPLCKSAKTATMASSKPLFNSSSCGQNSRPVSKTDFANRCIRETHQAKPLRAYPLTNTLIT